MTPYFQKIFPDLLHKDNEDIVQKEALIGDHNWKPLLVIPQSTIDWCIPLRNKQVIIQVHSYDIFFIYTRP